MRVAYVCADTGVPVFGSKGSSVHVQEVLRELVRRGHQVDLVATRVGGVVPLDLSGVRVHQASDDAEIAGVLSELGAVDLVYERYSLHGRAGTAFAVARGIPSVLEVNSPLIDEHLRHRAALDTVHARTVLRESVARATTVVCVSDPVARWVADRTGTRRLLVESNGVDVDRVRPPTSRPPRPFTAGFVGSFRPWHGLDLVLEVVARTPDVRLLLVGDGPARKGCEERAGRPDLRGRVELTGAVAPAEIPRQLARMHAGLAVAPPDAGGYFSPLKVLEYQAAGLPVVATRTAPVRRLVTHGRDGLLVTAGDAPALAAALRGLRDDDDLCRRLGAEGRRTAARHTWSAVVGRILDDALTHRSRAVA